MCRSSATLQRQAVTKDASGGMVHSYANVSGSVDLPCDIQPASGRVRDQYMQRNLAVTHTMYFPDDVTVLPGDRLTASGRTFLFQGKRPPAMGYDQWATTLDVEEQIRS